ncbi:MAG: NAD(P)-dependent oxidoreductase [Planctomycetes bacterium]|nr:NAD(P)-dependent oxidoreductase [Planctomycetota bacterium]
MSKRSLTVLVTGAAGRVGRAAAQELKARGHRVRAFDCMHSPGVEDCIVGNLTDAEAVAKAMAGIECVIHLAATPDEDDFMSKLLPNNVIGLYHVMEAARQAGVKRLILASTGQVVWGHEGPWPITPEMFPSPRNWYASTKLLAEAAGQAYAYRYGMSVLAVRLGWCPRTLGHVESIARSESAQDVYFSPGDAGRFFACAAESEKEIRFAVLFATSIPARKARYDLEPARRLIGYEPRETWPQGTEVVTGGRAHEGGPKV